MEQEIQQLKQRVQQLEGMLSILIFSDRYVFQKNLQFQDGRNIQLATGTGSKVGTAIGQKIGFFNATPVAQQAAMTAVNNSTIDTTYGTEERDVITNTRTRVSELETALENLGLIAVN